MKKRVCGLLCASALVLVATGAEAGLRTYVSSKHVYSMDDVQCDNTGLNYGTVCLDTANPVVDSAFFKDDYNHYAIDSAYGFDVMDFDPTVASLPRPRDGVFAEGWVAKYL